MIPPFDNTGVTEIMIARERHGVSKAMASSDDEMTQDEVWGILKAVELDMKEAMPNIIPDPVKDLIIYRVYMEFPQVLREKADEVEE